MEGDDIMHDTLCVKGISIHALRVEGDVRTDSNLLVHCISIHALRVEGDFYRLLSVFDITISIHALRVEGDTNCCCGSALCGNFNPRPPRGGRLFYFFGFPICAVFQSTPSAWRATLAFVPHQIRHTISIHALRVEGDRFHHQCRGES